MQATNASLVKPKKRIFVAEDDPEMCRVLVDSLRGEGYEVASAQNGGELLIALAQNNRFHIDAVDLIVSDIRMPVCSGLQVLATVRALRPRVRFLLVTGFGDEPSHAEAKRLGAVLLDKPFAVGDFLAEVAAVLAR